MRNAPLAALAFMLAACARADDTPAWQTARQFYDARLRSHADGAPDSTQLALLAPFVSDTLRALLAHARHASDSAAKAAPDEKPPFVEGDLFSSLFEGPTSFTVLPDTGARVRVRLVRAADGDTVRWTDTVVVRTEHGRRVVDDVAFGGRWDFANKGTLRAALKGAR